MVANPWMDYSQHTQISMHSTIQGELNGDWSGVEWGGTLQPGSVETLGEEGTWWYFLVNKPRSSWKPREIKEDVLLLNQQLWQNYPSWIDTYSYPKVMSDATLMLSASKG